MSQNWSPVGYGPNSHTIGQAVSTGGQPIGHEWIASAPQIESFNGYESTSFNPTFVDPPPSYAETIGDNVPSIQQQIVISANITEEEVRCALIEFVGKGCCYGSGPARDMTIRDIIMNNAFHYKLETFTEKRQPQWVYKPYKGEPISVASLGPPPTPWEVHVVPEVAFQRSSKTVEIPQTANVRVCHTCTGNGRIRCRDCSGYGGANCRFCNGAGRNHSHHHDDHHHHYHRHDHHCHHDRHHDCHCHRDHHHERCFPCDGTGRVRCVECDGHGQVKCQTCEGYCHLKYYLQLTVYWDNHEEDFISCEGNILSEDLVKQVSGNYVLEERRQRVHPLTNFPDRLVNETSRRLIAKHCRELASERVLEQRQSVEVIPIAFVAYSYKEKVGSFHVYGLEHKVHFAEYPSKCCGCSIL